MTNTLHDDAERLALKIFNDPDNQTTRSGNGYFPNTTDHLFKALSAAFNAGAEKMREEAIKKCMSLGIDIDQTTFPIRKQFAISINQLPLPAYEVKK